MLGEKLGEAQAATVTRVLPTEGSSPRFETSVDGGRGPRKVFSHLLERS